MKTFVAGSILIFAVLLVACRKENNPPVSPQVPQAPSATAPLDYLSQAGKAEQSMEKNIDVASLNNALQLFNVQEGRFPKDLNELVEKKYIGKVPAPPFGMKLQYDAKDGKVAVIKQ